jgi:hypothetical protein
MVSRRNAQSFVFQRLHELVGDVHGWLLTIVTGVPAGSGSPCLRMTAGQIDTCRRFLGKDEKIEVRPVWEM